MTCSISSKQEIKEDESLCKIVKAEVREEIDRAEEERRRQYRRRWLDEEI